MKRIIILVFLLPIGLFAQTGDIAGRVVDQKGTPMPGVNILVVENGRRASAGDSGDFVVKGIPSGSYSLRCSFLGYGAETVENVIVEDGKTTEVLIEMSEQDIQMQTVIITPPRSYDPRLEQFHNSISTVSSSDLEFRNTVSLEDALRYVPGVNLVESQVNIRGSSGYGRGVGSRVLMLVDGIPLLTGDTGELNFETIPAGQIERIEIVKGAASALYGSSALGGVINVITKSNPWPATSLRTYAGLYDNPSYAQWDWGGGTRLYDGQSVSQTLRISKTGLWLFASRMSDDGYKQNDFRRRYNFFAKTTSELSQSDVLTASINLFHQKRGSFLYWKDLTHALVPPDEQQGDQVQSTRFFLSGEYKHVFSDDLLLISRGMWFRNRWSDTVDTLTNNSNSSVVRGDLQFMWQPARDHLVIFGVEGSGTFVNADLFGDRRGTSIAFFAQDQIDLVNSLTLTLGARFDSQDLDSLESSNQLSPKVALLFKPFEWTTLRASYGAGFRAPSAAEAFITTQAGGLDIIPNPTLRPEHSHSFEIGAIQYLNRYAYLDIAFFLSNFKDLIEPRFVSSGGALKGQFNNITKARVLGFEISTKALMFDQHLSVDLGYTYVYPKDRTLDDILKYRPRHLFYAGLLARSGIFTAGIDFRYISRVERIDEEFKAFVSDADERVATYVTDLRFGVDLEKTGFPLSVNFNINNIFQYNYVELIGNLMPPRNYVLILEAQL